MKTAKDYLEDANKTVPTLSTEEAIALHGQGGVFVDVRDSADISTTGTIQGSVRIPRGFIEFAADDSNAFHNKSLKKDAKIYLVCGAGGQAALAGKTLIEMGYESVTNIGGFADWKGAGGPVEK